MHVQLCNKHRCDRHWDSRHQLAQKYHPRSSRFGNSGYVFSSVTRSEFQSCPFSAYPRYDSIVVQLATFSETTDTICSEDQCTASWFMEAMHSFYPKIWFHLISLLIQFVAFSNMTDTKSNACESTASICNYACIFFFSIYACAPIAEGEYNFDRQFRLSFRWRRLQSRGVQ